MPYVLFIARVLVLTIVLVVAHVVSATAAGLASPRGASASDSMAADTSHAPSVEPSAPAVPASMPPAARRNDADPTASLALLA